MIFISGDLFQRRVCRATHVKSVMVVGGPVISAVVVVVVVVSIVVASVDNTSLVSTTR